MDELSSDFPFVSPSDVIDIINVAESYIEKAAVQHGKFTSIKSNEIDYMLKRELFLTVPNSKSADENLREVFKNSTQAEVNAVLNEDNLDKDKYVKMHNILCDKCADKDICLEVFRTANK